jgi:integrase
LKLTWANVDLKTGTLFFPDTKNGEDRTVPLGAEALKALTAMTKGDGLVFTKNGKPLKDFRKSWEKALLAAGIGGKHLFHGNRRSQVMNLMASDVDEQVAMSITGHNDTNTFRGYRVLLEEAKRAAIAQRDKARRK